MTLRDRVRAAKVDARTGGRDVFARFGVLGNPFPSSSQTANNPRSKGPADAEVEERVVSFIRDHKTQVVVVQGSQGTGKTNVLNHFESEIADLHASGDLDGFYVIRYLADPEASFEGTIRRLFQELGVEHIVELAGALSRDGSPIEQARNVEVRAALRKLAKTKAGDGRVDTAEAFLDWLLGMRLLKAHRHQLGVNFRLDTVEVKTAALRDLVVVSSASGILNGIFLLLDELEKQDGVLSPAAVVRYLSALRAIIDALPNHLFLMVAITPDALRRYSVALPAFRSRLQDRIKLEPLSDADEALALAKFYLDEARKAAADKHGKPTSVRSLLSRTEIRDTFQTLFDRARRSGDVGLPQRTFLHDLYLQAERKIQDADA